MERRYRSFGLLLCHDHMLRFLFDIKNRAPMGLQVRTFGVGTGHNPDEGHRWCEELRPHVQRRPRRPSLGRWGAAWQLVPVGTALTG